MVFLEEVAKNIVLRWDNLGDFCIICPNKRTTDYLKHYLSEKIGKTIWSPKFLNIGELTQIYSDFKKADELVLQVELYKVFKDVFSESKFFKEYDFEKFYGIGEILIKDFNEIDNYLLNVDDIFRNISDYESINYIDDYLTDEQRETLQEFFGHFSGKDLSEEKEYFIELWDNIPAIYREFKQNLKNKGVGYNGLIISELSDKLKVDNILFNEYDKYLFVGFYSLTKGQKFFLKKIQAQGKALFYWDYDNFYTTPEYNEAGLFIRENLKEFSDDLDISRDSLSEQKNVSLIGFPLEIAQTKSLPAILGKMNINFDDKKQLANTAIVLPDDKLLFPVLHSLPPEIKQVNVTLGFPFRNSAVFSFIDKWFGLLQKLITNEKVFAEDCFKFIENQLVSEILSSSIDYVFKKFKDSKKVYFTAKDLLHLDNNFFSILFDERNLNSVDILLDNILLVLERIFRKIDAEDRKVEAEAIYQFYNQMLNTQSLFREQLAIDKNIISNKTLLKFLKQQLSGVHIPFTGKSLDGLQVMTIMETRNIDFENIILLNLNEQVLPKKAQHNSLISEFIRKSYGLPILLYQDSIFAYLFYRLLQNAKNIVFTYSNLISDKNGEISRFVQQLAQETNLIKEHFQYTEQIRPKRPREFEITKDDEVYSKLQEYIKSNNKFLSASALNTYISCSLKFYFKYIAQIEIKEEKEVDFEINAIKYGNVFHNSIEALYSPYIGKEINEVEIENIKQNIDNVVSEKILEELDNLSEAAKTGINNIIGKIVKRHIINLLDYDLVNVPFKIVSLETSTKYYGKINFELNEQPFNVNIYSVFDRVDAKNDISRIIDYKTGSEELSITDITKLFDTNSGYKYKGFFQMLLYSLVYKQNFPGKRFEPNIFLIKNIGRNYDGALFLSKDKIDNYSVEILNVFEENLRLLLSEIFDQNIPFNQTENTDNCTYCDYKGLCGF